MKDWTEPEVEDQFNRGCLLNRACGADMPLGLFDPKQRGTDSVPTIPAALVRSLLERRAPSDLRGFCRQAVRDRVDKFLNAFFEQNPK